ncbi:MAG TPA: DUF2703 domain-containing protein [Ignavibacteriales bacterium]|nr:DUF2703 domain-containing protein [Ignavibacteriales bacterium]
MIKDKLKVEIQLFEACPNADKMKARVLEAIQFLDFDVDYAETYVETPEMAEKVKFRGSPTVLVNGIDLENLPEPEKANLACRYYANGLPSVEEISGFLIQASE